MGEERLAALVLLNMHSDIEINPDKVMNRFVKQQPRRDVLWLLYLMINFYTHFYNTIIIHLQ